MNSKNKIFVIADDLSGACDIASTAAKAGVACRIIADSARLNNARLAERILIINTESRHLSAERAYAKVKRAAVFAQKAGPLFVFKKCDSTLRGNIGAELDAFVDVFNPDKIDFVPAAPELGRFTRNFIHYAGAKPVSSTFFAKDPKSPVKTSSLVELINSQSSRPNRITLHNVKSQKDLKKIASGVEVGLAAGSSGFFKEILAESAGVAIRKVGAFKGFNPRDGGILVVNGSKNPVSREQIDYFLQRLSTNRLSIIADRNAPKYVKLIERAGMNASAGRIVILDARGLGLNRPASVISRILSLARGCIEMYNLRYFVFFGGETSYRLCRDMGIKELLVTGWLENGISVCEPSSSKARRVISKPGGFGGKDFLFKALDMGQKF